MGLCSPYIHLPSDTIISRSTLDSATLRVDWIHTYFDQIDRKLKSLVFHLWPDTHLPLLLHILALISAVQFVSHLSCQPRVRSETHNQNQTKTKPKPNKSCETVLPAYRACGASNTVSSTLLYQYIMFQVYCRHMGHRRDSWWSRGLRPANIAFSDMTIHERWACHRMTLYSHIPWTSCSFIGSTQIWGALVLIRV